MKNFFDSINSELTGNLVVSIIDVILFAFLLYLLFAFLQKYNSTRLIKYIIALLIVSSVLSSEVLGFKVLGEVFSYGIIFVVVAVVIIFPQEIRRSLFKLSSPKDMQEAYTTKYDCPDEELIDAIDDIVRSVQNMAKKNVGALIIIAPDTVPAHILESGTEMGSKLSSLLIECLFNTKAPLHDGAVFIKANRILAAGCFLPLSQSMTIDKELGTRHRAAVGITEAYNVFAIIVSEETGVISTAYGGEIIRYYDSEMLTDMLKQIYGLKTANAGKRKKRTSNTTRAKKK